jgi:predicted nucleic-acid-binding protein
MISLDTNVLVRLATEDDQDQYARAKKMVEAAERKSEPLLILAGVLLETVWVLASRYKYNRKPIAVFLGALLSSPAFRIEHREPVRRAVERYAQEGDFEDVLFVEISSSLGAERFASFDKKIKLLSQDYVIQP